MNHQILKQDFLDTLEKNYLLNEKYFSYQNKVFYDFELIVFEIGKCLILNLNYATITLTNHFLERLLKLALIEKAVGLQLKPIHKLTEIYLEPSKKYGSLTMGGSIEQCKKEGLITIGERDFLYVFVRKILRNGFSHADPQKVLSEMEDETHYYIANGKGKKWETIIHDPKVIPQLQAAHMESFANEHASRYFDYVFELMKNIELRLIEFERTPTTSVSSNAG